MAAQGQGLFPSIRAWFHRPLSPNADLFNLTLYVGLIFVLAWLWSTVIAGIGRIGREVL
jgi:hypothetical protein